MDHPGVKLYRSIEESLSNSCPPPSGAMSDSESTSSVAKTGDVIEIKNNNDASLVIITTPPATHFTFTKLALEAGKDVVVEKPFVPTSKEAKILRELAEEKGRIVAVYQNRRWDTDFLTVKELIIRGDEGFGRIVEFESHFNRHVPNLPVKSANAAASSDGGSSSSWKTAKLPGGGAIYNLGSHVLDQFVHLFGLPDRVTGFIGWQRRGPAGETLEDFVHDSFTCLCHYDRTGMLATAKAGFVSPEVEQLRYWIRGEKGDFRKAHLDAQKEQLKEGLRPGQEGYGVEPAERSGVLTVMSTDGTLQREAFPNVPPLTWAGFYAELAEALHGKGEVPVNIEDAEQVIRLIELAKLSSQRGCTLLVNAHEDGIDS